jgi:hypothetical protein
MHMVERQVALDVGRHDRAGRGCAAGHAQFGVDGVEDLVRVGRLAQHRGHTAAGRHRQRFAFGVHGREEDHAGALQRRLGAQLLDEFVAVHRRHQDVGDDQVG